MSYDSHHDNDNDDVTINPDNEADTSLQDITVTSPCQPIRGLHHPASDQSEARDPRDPPLGVIILIHCIIPISRSLLYQSDIIQIKTWKAMNLKEHYVLKVYIFKR